MSTLGLTLMLSSFEVPHSEVVKLSKRCPLLKEFPLQHIQPPSAIISASLVEVQIAIMIDSQPERNCSMGQQVYRDLSADIPSVDSSLLFDDGFASVSPLASERLSLGDDHFHSPSHDSFVDSLFDDCMVQRPMDGTLTPSETILPDDDHSDDLLGSQQRQSAWPDSSFSNLLGTIDSAIRLAILPDPRALLLRDVTLTDNYSFVGLADMAPAVFRPDYLQVRSQSKCLGTACILINGSCPLEHCSTVGTCANCPPCLVKVCRNRTRQSRADSDCALDSHIVGTRSQATQTNPQSSRNLRWSKLLIATRDSRLRRQYYIIHRSYVYTYLTWPLFGLLSLQSDSLIIDEYTLALIWFRPPPSPDLRREKGHPCFVATFQEDLCRLRD